MSSKRTLFEKIWNAHKVTEPSGRSPIIYIDLHLVHEVTTPQAFDGLRAAGRKVRQPERTVATVDHNIPTEPRGTPITDLISAFDQETRQNVGEFVRHWMKRPGVPQDFRSRYEGETSADANAFQPKEAMP